MWCLWNLGLLGEPLLGAVRASCRDVYVLTGIAGNLLSVGWHVALARMSESPEVQDGSVGRGCFGGGLRDRGHSDRAA